MVSGAQDRQDGGRRGGRDLNALPHEGGAQVVPLPSKYGTGAASAGTGSNVAGCAIEDERTIKIEETGKRK
jgi:hypothetical protein